MADDVRVEFSLETTINLGNFENVRPGYRVSANVRPGEHPDRTRERLQSLVNGWLQDDVDSIRKDK